MSVMSYDAELRLHNEALRKACGVQRGEHVLDIGCGSGLTTREAALAAIGGSAVGIDISAAAIERARELAVGFSNITFEYADAELHPFPSEHFDLAMSRFGTMFFADPGAAFANIRRALRRDGRLVMMVWQSADDNAWYADIHRALAGSAAPVAAHGPDPFSLADPAAVKQLLEAEGFADITFTGVSEPLFYGPDVDTAAEWILGFISTSTMLKEMEPAGAERAVDRLRAALSAQQRDDGIWFDSSAWLIAARKP